jgi:oxalate decarboxylase
MISRREMFAATAAGAVMTAMAPRAATYGNPDEPPQGAINANKGEHYRSRSAESRSRTSVSFGNHRRRRMPMDSASFNNAPRRIQYGGWALQVTQADFSISETISGVDMRLAAGGIRELRWNQAAECTYMTYGNCRVTVLDTMGRPHVADVKGSDVWYFPAGYPHPLRGMRSGFRDLQSSGAASGPRLAMVSPPT